MNVLSWNCRGLGKSSAVQALLDIIQQQRPQKVFLCETKSDVRKLESVRRTVGFDCAFSVAGRGRSGGLCLLRREELELAVLSLSISHIDVQVTFLDSMVWRFTGFYGCPVTTENHGLCSPS